MRFLSILAGALAFGSAIAAPFPGTDSGSDLVERARAPKARTAKYKLASKPPQGKTGVWTDGKTKTTHIFYGDDVKTHGSHIEYHNQVHPQNAGKAFKIASGTSKKGEIADNRKAALAKIKTQGKGFVRDEKPLASLSHGAKRTTVMKVPEKESLIEGHLARIAKSSAKKNGGTVVLHDHRTVTGTGPLGKILKKRDIDTIEERGLGDKISNGIDSLKNKTESGIEDLKNSTLTREFLDKFDDFEKKFSGLLDKVTGEMKGAGDDIITAVKQLTFSTEHQMGGFYKGLYNFDAVEEAMQANGTKLSDDDLAQDQAAIDVYQSGFANATKAIGENVMNDFYKFTDLVLGIDGGDDDEGDSNPAKDLFEVGTVSNKAAANATKVDDCDEKNKTAAAATRRAEVKLW